MKSQKFVQDSLLSRDLFWLTITMGFLASMFVTSAIEISSRLTTWRLGFSGYATVQVLPIHQSEDNQTQANLPQADLQERVEKTIIFFESSPLIVSVEVLEDAKVRSLLTPWIGEAANLQALPVPTVIDLRFESERADDVNGMFSKLLATVKGVRIDDHSQWLRNATQLAWTIQVLAAIVGLVVLSVVILTVTHFVRSSLAERHKVVELLHTLGATRIDISSCYMKNIITASLAGAGLGHSLAAILFAFVLSFLPDLISKPGEQDSIWTFLSSPLLATPVIIVIVVLVALSSRQTILNALRELPYNDERREIKIP